MLAGKYSNQRLNRRTSAYIPKERLFVWIIVFAVLISILLVKKADLLERYYLYRIAYSSSPEDDVKNLVNSSLSLSQKGEILCIILEYSYDLFGVMPKLGNSAVQAFRNHKLKEASMPYLSSVFYRATTSLLKAQVLHCIYLGGAPHNDAVDVLINDVSTHTCHSLSVAYCMAIIRQEPEKYYKYNDFVKKTLGHPTPFVSEEALQTDLILDQLRRNVVMAQLEATGILIRKRSSSNSALQQKRPLAAGLGGYSLPFLE